MTPLYELIEERLEDEHFGDQNPAVIEVLEYLLQAAENLEEAA